MWYSNAHFVFLRGAILVVEPAQSPRAVRRDSKMLFTSVGSAGLLQQLQYMGDPYMMPPGVQRTLMHAPSSIPYSPCLEAAAAGVVSLPSRSVLISLPRLSSRSLPHHEQALYTLNQDHQCRRVRRYSTPTKNSTDTTTLARSDVYL